MGENRNLYSSLETFLNDLAILYTFKYYFIFKSEKEICIGGKYGTHHNVNSEESYGLSSFLLPF